MPSGKMVEMESRALSKWKFSGSAYELTLIWPRYTHDFKLSEVLNAHIIFENVYTHHH